jgi:hypothetical protein
MATATAIPTRRLIRVDGLCALFEALVADGCHVIGPSGVFGRVPGEPTPAATVRRARSALEGTAPAWTARGTPATWAGGGE